MGKTMDNVKCNWCDAESLVEVGDVFCPQCGREGHLETIIKEAKVVWVEEESCYVLEEDYNDDMYYEEDLINVQTSSLESVQTKVTQSSKSTKSDNLPAISNSSRIGKMALLGSELLEVMEERTGVEEVEYLLKGKDYWINSSWIKLFKEK